MTSRRSVVLGVSIALSVALAGGLAGGTAWADSALPTPPPIPTLPSVTALAAQLPALPGQPSAPQKDPFYRPPSGFWHAEPGELLHYRTSYVGTSLASQSPARVRAWQVLYRSVNARNSPDAVSGTVLVPDSAWTGPGARPIVTYVTGSQGLGDQCAPSYQLATGTELEYLNMTQALAKGWAVAITDLEGLGTPGDHTYQVASSEGRATLDIVRAAMQLPGADLSRDSFVGIWGYSQGGGAAASAGEQAQDYAPELRTVGVAEGGVPANLRAVLDNLDGGALFGAVAAAVAGFDTAYPALGIPRLMTASGNELLGQIRTECILEFAQQANHHLREYTQIPSLLDYPPLAYALRENRIGGTTPDIPVLLYQAQLDEVVPGSVAQDLLSEYCHHGARVWYHEVPGVSHFPGGSVGAPAAVEWLADRFDNKPAPSSCPVG
jgi:uncharacterized membrane protein